VTAFDVCPVPFYSFKGSMASWPSTPAILTSSGRYMHAVAWQGSTQGSFQSTPKLSPASRSPSVRMRCLAPPPPLRPHTEPNDHCMQSSNAEFNASDDYVRANASWLIITPAASASWLLTAPKANVLWLVMALKATLLRLILSPEAHLVWAPKANLS
jgi:hypothetical protein